MPLVRSATGRPQSVYQLAHCLVTDILSTLPQVGGVPAVLKLLLQEGFIDGSCLTVTGTPSITLHPLLSVPPQAAYWLRRNSFCRALVPCCTLCQGGH